MAIINSGQTREPPKAELTIVGQSWLVDFTPVNDALPEIYAINPEIDSPRALVDELLAISHFMIYDSYYGITTADEGKYTPDTPSGSAAYQLHCKGSFLFSLCDVLQLAGHRLNIDNFDSGDIPDLDAIVRDMQENAQTLTAVRTPEQSLQSAFEALTQFTNDALLQAGEVWSQALRKFSVVPMRATAENGHLGDMSAERIDFAERLTSEPTTAIKPLDILRSSILRNGSLACQKV